MCQRSIAEKQIEDLRARMREMVEAGLPLSSPEVLEVSWKIDELMVVVQPGAHNKGKVTVEPKESRAPNSTNQ